MPKQLIIDKWDVSTHADNDDVVIRSMLGIVANCSVDAPEGMSKESQQENAEAIVLAMSNTYGQGIHPQHIGALVSYLNNICYKLGHRQYDAAKTEAAAAEKYIDSIFTNQ